MSIIQGVLLGILQGVTEFLPISSSGHLKIARELLFLFDVPLLFDVFLHLATLLAVTLYFRKTLARLLCVLCRWPLPHIKTNAPVASKMIYEADFRDRKTIAAVIIATIVTGAIGVPASKFIPDLHVKFVCVGFIATAILLLLSAKAGTVTRENSESGLSVKQALFIGLAQGIGTLPGISRSGATIAVAMLCGVPRSDAGEFSFIASIPAVLGAFILEIRDIDIVSMDTGIAPVFAGCAAAFVSGYAALSCLMKLIKRGRLDVFAYYLIPAGILGLLFL